MAFKNIGATLDDQGILRIDSLPNINQGENVSVGIVVNLSPEFTNNQPQNATYYLEFKTPNNQKYVTPIITPADGKLVCDVKNSVLSSVGEAQVQLLVLQKESNYLFKSNVATFFVNQSINAVQEEFFTKDFLLEANKVLANVSAFEQKLQDVIQTVQTKLDNGEFVGEKGEKGDKGDKGDVGEVPQFSIQGGNLIATTSEGNKTCGRTSGISIYTTTQQSNADNEIVVNRSDVYPQDHEVLPGDKVVFANGDVRMVTSGINYDTVTCGNVLSNLCGPEGDDGAGSNPNILLNGNFIINQRGQTTYTGKGYNFDRWKGDQSEVVELTSLGNSGGINIKISDVNAGTGSIFRQVMDVAEIGQFLGKTLTLSYKVKNFTGTSKHYLRVGNQSNTNIASTTQTNETGIFTTTFVLPIDTTRLGIYLRKATGSFNLDLEWIKLEVGSIATSFIPRSFEEELAMCQRYAVELNPTRRSYAWIAQGMATSSTEGNIILPLSIPLRTVPTIIITGNASIRGILNTSSYNNDAEVSLTASQIMGTTVPITFTTPESSRSAGENAFLRTTAANTSIFLDAEIY